MFAAAWLVWSTDHGTVRMSARCLACGGAAVARERRVLNSEAARNVLSAWKEIVHLKAIELRVSLSEQFLAAVGTEQSDRPGCMCKKCFSMFERYLRIKEAVLNTIHATISAPTSAIPSTPIDASHRDPSRKRPAEDDSANSAKCCRLGEQPVPLQHLNPTGGKEPCRKLNFARTEPGRSPGVAVSSTISKVRVVSFIQPSGM